MLSAAWQKHLKPLVMERSSKMLEKEAAHLPFTVKSVGGNDVSGFDKNPPWHHHWQLRCQVVTTKVCATKMIKDIIKCGLFLTWHFLSWTEDTSRENVCFLKLKQELRKKTLINRKTKGNLKQFDRKHYFKIMVRNNTISKCCLDIYGNNSCGCFFIFFFIHWDPISVLDVMLTSNQRSLRSH